MKNIIFFYGKTRNIKTNAPSFARFIEKIEEKEKCNCMKLINGNCTHSFEVEKEKDRKE